MPANLTPEQIKQILNAHHAKTAQIEADNAKCDAALQNFKAIMARNQSKIRITRKPHMCSRCYQTFPAKTRMWITPGVIAARSSRCTDPTFTKARYTCLSCAPEVKQPCLR